jgi:hypothetical protein
MDRCPNGDVVAEPAGEQRDQRIEYQDAYPTTYSFGGSTAIPESQSFQQ